MVARLLFCVGVLGCVGPRLARGGGEAMVDWELRVRSLVALIEIGVVAGGVVDTSAETGVTKLTWCLMTRKIPRTPAVRKDLYSTGHAAAPNTTLESFSHDLKIEEVRTPAEQAARGSACTCTCKTRDESAPGNGWFRKIQKLQGKSIYSGQSTSTVDRVRQPTWAKMPITNRDALFTAPGVRVRRQEGNCCPPARQETLTFLRQTTVGVVVRILFKNY